MPATLQELGMIDDFQHVSITCRDLERSVRFYKALGLEVIKRIGEVDEEGIAHAFQLPRGHLAVVYLAAPKATGQMFIDLVQWLEPPSTGESYPALNHVGLNRIAFRVSDIDATTAALRERGIAFPEPRAANLWAGHPERRPSGERSAIPSSQFIRSERALPVFAFQTCA